MYEVKTEGFTGITPTDPFETRPHNGMKFSTFDNDNDRSSRRNCALNINKSGWWYNDCQHINPNQQTPWIPNSRNQQVTPGERVKQRLD